VAKKASGAGRGRKKPIKPPPSPIPAPVSPPNGHPPVEPARPVSSAGGARIPLLTANHIVPQELEWLIPDLIPRYELTLVTGPTDSGKSLLFAYVMSTVTGGYVPPPASQPPRGRVLYYGREGNLRGRLWQQWSAASVDVSRVHCGDEDMLQRPIDAPHLPEQAAELERLVEACHATLLILDPIKSYLSPLVGENDAKGVRAALEALQQIARRHGVTVLGVAHPRKGQAEDAMMRISGHREWSQTPRHILSLSRDPRDREKRVIAVQKSAIGGIPPPRWYRIVPSTPAVRFVLGAVAGIDRDDLQADVDDSITRSHIEQAKLYLRETLEAEEPRQAAVVAWCQREGVGYRTMERAKSELGVRSKLIHAQGERYQVWMRPEKWPDDPAI
jgi:hypothetical protein